MSDSPTSSQPAAIRLSASRAICASGIAPSSVQPKAVERLPSKCGRWSAGSAAINAAIVRASSITCAWVRRRLARLCVSDTDSGSVILSAPAAIAASAPRALGTSTATVRPGIVLAKATTSAVSASCGRSLAGTKLPTSISVTPAAASAAIHAFLAASGMIVPMLCSPSRGPTSLISTSVRWSVTAISRLEVMTYIYNK